MKSLIKTLALAALTLLPLTAMTAESDKPTSDKTHKVVFEVTSDGQDADIPSSDTVYHPARDDDQGGDFDSL